MAQVERLSIETTDCRPAAPSQVWQRTGRQPTDSPTSGQQPQPLSSECERSQTIKQLQKEVRRLELGGQPASPNSATSTGCEAMDRSLPYQGYRPGTVIEYLRTNHGCGASYLALSAASTAMKKTGGFLVVVDLAKHFYPPAIAAHGIDLAKVIFVHPSSAADAIWSMDQALRTPAVAAVIGEPERLDDRSARRLQLAAESGQGLALLLRSVAVRHSPSWAEVQWLVRSAVPPQSRPCQPVSSEGTRQPTSPLSTHSPTSPFDANTQLPPGRQLQVKLLRNRGGKTGAIIPLEINAITGAIHSAAPIRSNSMRERNRHEQTATMRLATELASPKSTGRSAATG